MYRRTDSLDYMTAELTLWLPRVLGALAILLVAWLIARAVRWGIGKAVDRVPALQRHQQVEGGKSLGSLLGDVAFWLILLIGIMLALQPLGLSQVLEPVRQLTTNVFGFIPNLIAGGLIFVIGLVVAKIVRRLVEGALMAANADGWMRRAGLGDNAAGSPATPTGAAPSVSTSGPSLSKSVGTVVFFLIMIPVTIAALEALRIDAISGPATQMLRTILDAIPYVLGALILLAIGYFVGKLAKQAIEQILPSMGFDRAVGALGFSSSSNTPSRTVGTIVMLAILLFFAVKAAELLRSPLIATMLAEILALGGQVLFGSVIILAGVVIARVVSGLAGGAGESWLPTILKWAIIALAVAMGLRFMGLANEIVIIAFAGIIGSAAVASALAFGLGGRQAAGQLLQRYVDGGLPPPPSGSGAQDRAAADKARAAADQMSQPNSDPSLRTIRAGDLGPGTTAPSEPGRPGGPGDPPPMV